MHIDLFDKTCVRHLKCVYWFSLQIRNQYAYRTLHLHANDRVFATTSVQENRQKVSRQDRRMELQPLESSARAYVRSTFGMWKSPRAHRYNYGPCQKVLQSWIWGDTCCTEHTFQGKYAPRASNLRGVRVLYGIACSASENRQRV